MKGFSLDDRVGRLEQRVAELEAHAGIARSFTGYVYCNSCAPKETEEERSKLIELSATMTQVVRQASPFTAGRIAPPAEPAGFPHRNGKIVDCILI